MPFSVRMSTGEDFQHDYAIQFKGDVVEKWFVEGQEVSALEFADSVMMEILELREQVEALYNDLQYGRG